MRYRQTLLFIATLMVAGCKPSESTAVTPVAPATTASTVAQTPAPAPAPAAVADVTAGFTEGMAYADLRKRLLDAGWLPLRDPMCRENVGGEAAVCFELPEVEACSGDGHCVMHFAHADDGQTLRVTSYGPYDRWNRPGEKSAFAVRSWERSASSAAAESAEPAVACPSRDFDAFLKAFASDDKIKHAFTAPLVKVAGLGGGEDGDDPVMTYESAGNYTGFNVVHAGGVYHFVDSEGARDSSPLVLKVEAQGQAVRNVRYQYGMSEGNSYRFENRNGCWVLTEDPEPPSP